MMKHAASYYKHARLYKMDWLERRMHVLSFWKGDIVEHRRAPIVGLVT